MREKIKNLWHSPIISNDEEGHRARLLYPILGMSLLAALAFTVVSLLQADTSGAWASIAVFFVCLVSLWLVRRGSLVLPSYLLPLTFLAALTYELIHGYGVHDIAVSMYPLVIVFAALILGRRAMIAFFILATASIILVVTLEMHGAITPNWAEATDYSDVLVRSEEHTSELQSPTNLVCR